MADGTSPDSSYGIRDEITVGYINKNTVFRVAAIEACEVTTQDEDKRVRKGIIYTLQAIDDPKRRVFFFHMEDEIAQGLLWENDVSAEYLPRQTDRETRHSGSWTITAEAGRGAKRVVERVVRSKMDSESGGREFFAIETSDAPGVNHQKGIMVYMVGRRLQQYSTREDLSLA